MKTTPRARLRQLILYTTIFGFSACGADSCSCDGFVAQEFPLDKVAKTIPTSGEARVTPAGLDFLSDNLPTIVSGLLPGGLSFCVPPTSQSGLNVCDDGTMCSSGGPGCDMTLTIDDAEITPVPTDTLEVAITIGDLNEELPVEVIGADCTLRLYSKADDSQPATIDGTIPITFAVDNGSPFRDVSINVGDPEVDLSDVDFDIDPVNFLDFLVCEGIDLVAAIGFVRNLAIGLLTDQFVPLIQEQVDSQLCVQCDAGCPAGTTCDGEGVCRYPDDRCAQSPLGISGQLQLGTVLADYTERPQAAVDLTVRVADEAIVNDGLTLGLRSGYDPVDTAVCVPVDPTVRDFVAPPMSPTVTGNVTPTGQPFHFGLGYHKKAIESMLWSVWASGGTCLNVGTKNIPLVTTGALGALLPSMKQLAYQKTSEAYIKIVPQRPPQVVLGANRVTPNGSSYTVDDPLMTIDWKDFDVHIYAFAQDRFTRIVTIRMDLLLPIALVSDGMGSIIPVIGDLDEAFTNERIVAGELVAEDPARILDLLPTLIGFALPSLAGSISQPVALPEFFGFRIDIPEGNITSVDGNTSIAIFANLALAAGMPYIQGVQTSIAATEVDLSARTPSGLVRPKVYVDMVPFAAELGLGSDVAVEYSYRVDGGTWSLFHRSNRLEVDAPLLVIPGEHLIEVRARRVGEPASVDATPASVRVLIDWEAPTLEIERDGAEVRFEASDALDAEGLEYRYKVIDGVTPSVWTAWSGADSLDLEELRAPDRFRLDVEVRDRAGNVGRDSQTVTWTAALQPQGAAPATAASAPQAGCNTASGGAVDAGWLLLVGLGFLAVRLRRRVRVEALGLAAVVCFGACKCGDDGAGNLVCEPTCAQGQQCVEGACVTTAECTTDADCSEGEVCGADGQCAQAPSCESQCDCPDGELAVCDENDQCGCIPYCDKGCGEGEYCCYESNSCEPLADPCAEVVCDPGYHAVEQTPPAGDSATCAVTAGTCACEELPPLPLGWHGHYAAIDRNAGVTAIATYNSTYTDLMVGVVDAALGVTWQFVDGMPAAGDIEGSLNGPRGGIADKGDDVGRFTALAIDDTGVLHVFYRDNERSVMKYARGTAGAGGYSWDLSDFDTDGDAGYWASALHQDGRVHVVYAVKSAADGAGGFLTELRHVSFDATGSVEDPTATRVAVDTGAAAHPCGADCTDRQAQCIASIGECQTPTNDCSGACADGTACYQGSCQATYKEPPVGVLRAIGTHAQLSTTPDGLLVTYYDDTRQSVAWSRFDGSVWSAPTFVGTGTGPWVSGMVDGAGDLHLAYTERVGEVPQLTYADVAASTTEKIQDGIRDTANWWLVNDIGDDVDLRVAADGTVSVLYQDATEHELRLATRGAGGWTVTDVATPGAQYSGAHGFYAAMLRLPDAQLSVNLVINNQLDPTEAAPQLHD